MKKKKAPRYTLKDYEGRVKSLMDSVMNPLNNRYLLYNFFYSYWIQAAYDRFQLEKCSKQIEATNFDDWVNLKLN